jgi:hypothetical protein
MPSATDLAERPRTPYHQPRTPRADGQAHRQSFHHPRTSLGATGHWIKTLGILSPLVIGEFVKDPEQRWRLIRMASVVTALVSEAFWTAKIHRERQECDHQRDR